MLVENSGKISSLYGRCFQAERDCSEVERQLSLVEHGQADLEALLERYEADVGKMVENDRGVDMSGVDVERERTYVNYLTLCYFHSVFERFANNRV